MIIVMKPTSTKEDLARVTKKIESVGLSTHLSVGKERTIVGVIGDKKIIANLEMNMMPGVEKTVRITEKYKLVSREFHPEDSVIDVAGVPVGGKNLVVMAGPCSVESTEQLEEAAEAVAKCGAKFLRGGAFKPRTSPYAFQGLRGDGIRLLLEAKRATGMPVITEIMDISQLDLFDEVDIIQVGARNMQNFEMLKQLGKVKKPILLKRGLSNTYQELLMSAEYIMSGGNENLMLCERGIRTFETFTRNTLDVSAVPVLKELSHLPVVIDPSHAAGLSRLVEPLSLSAVAAGCDALMIEVHNDPPHAKCDGPQSLRPEAFDRLARKVRAMRSALTSAEGVEA